VLIDGDMLVMFILKHAVLIRVVLSVVLIVVGHYLAIVIEEIYPEVRVVFQVHFVVIIISINFVLLVRREHLNLHGLFASLWISDEELFEGNWVGRGTLWHDRLLLGWRGLGTLRRCLLSFFRFLFLLCLSLVLVSLLEHIAHHVDSLVILEGLTLLRLWHRRLFLLFFRLLFLGFFLFRFFLLGFLLLGFLFLGFFLLGFLFLRLLLLWLLLFWFLLLLFFLFFFLLFLLFLLLLFLSELFAFLINIRSALVWLTLVFFVFGFGLVELLALLVHARVTHVRSALIFLGILFLRVLWLLLFWLLLFWLFLLGLLLLGLLFLWFFLLWFFLFWFLGCRGWLVFLFL